MKTVARNRRSHSKLWVTGLFCLCVLLCSSKINAGEQAKPLPDEIKNLTSEQIFVPKPRFETIYPLRAKKDGVNADVWVKYKIHQGKIDSAKVVFSSKDGYDLGNAAIMSLKEYDFSKDTAAVKLENSWLYTKVTFGYGETKHTTVMPPDSEQLVEVMPELIFRGVPEYPKIALIEGIEATVFVKVMVGASGKPLDAKIAKSSEMYDNYGFNNAVLKAAMQCRFKPAMQGGKQVVCWVTFPYEFTISRK